MMPGAEHVRRTGSLAVHLPPEEALPLFTAEGERTWVDGWAPEYLHVPGEGDAATRTVIPGTVFRTRHGGEETLWMVLEYDPSDGVARYARFTPGSRLGTVSVQCDGAEGGNETRVAVTYEMTAVSGEGARVLADMTDEAYGKMLAAWEERLGALVAR